jgi:hypothetical protein
MGEKWLLLYSPGWYISSDAGIKKKSIHPSILLGYHTLPEQFRQSPYVICDASFDRWRNPDALVDAAKIVVGEVQCDSRFQMCQLFAKSICESRKSPHLHSHRQIAALYEAC